MENIFGLVVFLVFVISAIARMVQESKKGSAKRPKGQEPLTRDMLPEATRRKLYGDGGDSGPRMATPKQAQPRTATPVRREGPARREEPLAPGRQLLDALTGRAQSMEEEEEWTPAQPPPRRELPRAVQPPPPPPLPQAPPRVVARQEQRPRRRERSSQQTAQVRQAQPPRQRTPRRTRQSSAKRAVPTASRRRGPSSVLFGGLNDVRKAIVFAEILGPPKSME